MEETTVTGPFGKAARTYISAGWAVFPLGNRPGEKSPPPLGVTGHDGRDLSGADVEAYLETHANRNIGIRAPEGVIGLDVDAYAGKRGEATLAALEAEHGPLPLTWVTSARPAPSGIRWFRVPLELDGKPINWPGEAGPHIEIIQHGHRYGVAPPSTNPHANGARYEWRGMGVAWAKEYVPTVDKLAELPESWVRGLALAYARAEKGSLDTPELARWWDLLAGGSSCSPVSTVLNKALEELRVEASSRHETARDAAAALARFGGEGHRGVRGALALLETRFVEVAGEGRRGEWRRLLAGAVQLAATKNPTPTVVDPCSPPALKGISVDFPVPAEVVAPAAPPAAGELTLPESFWAARSSLQLIRQSAHARVRSGDVVFYGVLTRLAALTPHTLRLDTGIGESGSLNLLAAIVGPSGTGKSSGLSVSRGIFPDVAHLGLEEVPLGSGEGLAEAFMGVVWEASENGAMNKDGSAKKEKVRKQVRHNVLAHADEGAALNKLLERSGSTVGETLRSAWSGETIGQKNGREETTRIVRTGQYSVGLLIGYQPETVLPLLADVAAGTPQRFLFAWAVDPTIPARGARVARPGMLPSPFPPEVETDEPGPERLYGKPSGRDTTPITFPPEVRDELYDYEHDKASGAITVDPYYSQHSMMRVKVAALLALLDSGRRQVSLEDWQLAGVVLSTSDRVRDHLLNLKRDAEGKAWAGELARRREASIVDEHGRREAAGAHEVEAVRRIAVRLAAKVRGNGGPLTRAAARRAIAARDRPLFDDAADLACEQKWIEEAPGGYVAGMPLP